MVLVHLSPPTNAGPVLIIGHIQGGYAPGAAVAQDSVLWFRPHCRQPPCGQSVVDPDALALPTGRAPTNSHCMDAREEKSGVVILTGD